MDLMHGPRQGVGGPMRLLTKHMYNCNINFGYAPIIGARPHLASLNIIGIMLFQTKLYNICTCYSMPFLFSVCMFSSSPNRHNLRLYCCQYAFKIGELSIVC